LPHRVAITLFFIALLTIAIYAELRTHPECSAFLRILLFLSMLIMIIYGIYKVNVEGFTPQANRQVPEVMSGITLFLILRAFAAGCTALTV
jgi:hypothetical protein